MLFDIEQETELEVEDQNFDIFPEYEEESSENNAPQSTSQIIEENGAHTPNYANAHDNSPDNNYNPKQKVILIALSVEALLFMLIHLFFYLTTKLIFPTLNIQNTTLITVTVFFYFFIFVYSIAFKGKIFSLVLLERTLNTK